MTAIQDAGFKEGYADLSRDRIHYVEYGEGKPLVCLHGGGPGASGFSNFKLNAPGFAEAGYRVIMPDKPQFGKSSKPFIEGSRLNYFGKAMIELADYLELGTSDWIGNSSGGGTALRVALDRPDLVNRLALMGSAGMPPSLLMPSPLEGVKVIGEYYSGTGPSEAKMEKIVRTFMYNQDRVTPELIKERYEASIDPELMKLWEDGYIATRHKSNGPEDLSGEISKIEAPTLLIWGRDDRMVSLDAALMFLHRLPNSRLYMIPKCGHWAQGEYPEEFNNICIDFFAGKIG